MRLDEIVAGEVESNRRLKVFYLLAERQRQTIQSLNVQASRSIQPFNVS